MGLIWDSNPMIECPNRQTHNSPRKLHPSNYKLPFQNSNEMKRLLKDRAIDVKEVIMVGIGK